MSNSARSSINCLLGEPLSGVAFVQDYVEFHFDGRVLRSLTPPFLRLGGDTFKFPERGSRDAFCFLIGRTVERILVDDEEQIELAFSSEALLTVPLIRSARTGPEAAHFVPGENQPMEVW